MDIFPFEDLEIGWNRSNVAQACQPLWTGLYCGDRSTSQAEQGRLVGFTPFNTPDIPKNMTGYIPDSITDCTSLEKLMMSAIWTRELPRLAKLTNLTEVIYSFPNGPEVSRLGIEAFPEWLFEDCPRLEQFTWDNHNLVGVYANFSKMPATVKRVNFCNSSAIGPFPDFSQCKNMTSFYAYGNHFTGPIPDWLDGNFTGLRYLNMADNELSGELPQSMSGLRLEQLNLTYNNLAGDASVLEGIIIDGGNNSYQCQLSFNGINFTCSNPGNPPGNPCCSGYAPRTCLGYTCTCTSNFSLALSANPQVCRNGTWIVGGTATNNNTITVSQGDTIIIDSSLEQSDKGSLEVHVNGTNGGSIQVAGPAQLGGNLVIVLSSNQTTNYSIPILSAGVINGTFSNVTLVQDFVDPPCTQTKVTPTYSNTAVSVLISQTRITTGKGCAAKKKSSRVLAIGLGAGVGGVVLVLIVIIILLVILQKSGKCGSLFSSRTQQENFDYHTTSEGKL